jgi:hypothetical protein
MLTRRADMRLQCSAGPVDHSSGTATVSGDPTARRHTVGRARRGGTTIQGVHHAVKDIICYSYPVVPYYIGIQPP